MYWGAAKESKWSKHGFGVLPTGSEQEMTQEELMEPEHLQGSKYHAQRFYPTANQTLEAADQQRNREVGPAVSMLSTLMKL